MTGESITFAAPGPPVSKGRPKFRKDGRTYTPKKTHDYEVYLGVLGSVAMRRRPPMLGPIHLTMIAEIPIPKSWSKTKKDRAALGELTPGKPDIDNYIKIVLDGLNKIVFVDDAQVVKISAMKRYSTAPSMLITVRPCPNELSFRAG